jgi:hypothetical protein
LLVVDVKVGLAVTVHKPTRLTVKDSLVEHAVPGQVEDVSVGMQQAVHHLDLHRVWHGLETLLAV